MSTGKDPDVPPTLENPDSPDTDESETPELDPETD